MHGTLVCQRMAWVDRSMSWLLGPSPDHPVRDRIQDGTDETRVHHKAVRHIWIPRELANRGSLLTEHGTSGQVLRM
jgi:hypothetical protein